MRKNYPSSRFILLLAISLLIFSCKKDLQSELNNPGTIDNSENIKYQSWLIKNGLSFKNGNINVKKDDRTVISGKVDWSKGEKYHFNGREYLEIPFLFDHQSFIYSEETSRRSQFSLVFRNLPNDGLEAAIKSTTSGKIIQLKNNIKIEGTVRSYTLINGDKRTLWVKNKHSKEFIKVRRIEKSTLRPGNTSPSLMRSNCTGYTTVEYTVSCEAESDYTTTCSVVPQYSDYTICENDKEEYDNGDWGGGGGGGGGDPPPPIEQPDPCATAQAQAVTTFSANTNFQNAKSQIQGAVHDGAEHGISFGKENDGTVIKSAMSTGNENSGTAPSISNKFADIHNHRDNSPPSPGDIYAFIDGIINQPNFTIRYVISSGGDVYALVLTDKQAAINFNNNNPRFIETYMDNQGIERKYPPDFPKEIFDKIGEVKGSLFNNGVYNSLLRDESSLSYILQQYNVGISLVKMNNSGEFKKIKTKETNANGNFSYKPDNCL